MTNGTTALKASFIQQACKDIPKPVSFLKVICIFYMF